MVRFGYVRFFVGVGFCRGGFCRCGLLSVWGFVVVVVVCPREPTRVNLPPGAAQGEAVRIEEGRRRREWLKGSE